MAIHDPARGVVCVVGTRPEVVKLAPVLLRLRQIPALRVRLVSTGQHRALLDQALGEFGLAADHDLALMQPDQSPADVLARGLSALGQLWANDLPDLVIAQGDTTTVLCSALAAFYARRPFAHVEAGLRTHNPDRPFPEETQRVLVSHLAALHFAPTSQARRNLLAEGIADTAITVTGNTVIDALHLFQNTAQPAPSVDPGARLLLVTAHRRENFGAPMERICSAIATILDLYPDVSVLWPVHPNPNVRGPVERALGALERVTLTEPLGYSDFLASMARASVIVTDSGGVQEEAPALGKPVVVLREETERGEGLTDGRSALVGSDPTAIVAAIEHFLSLERDLTSCRRPLVGDGWASERIARIVARRFGIDPGPEPIGFETEFGEH